jgi:SAM-dependent methyltransferase
MNLKEKATILHYHRNRLSTHGQGSVLALGWKEQESQSKRFEVIADAWDFSGASILDVGCDYGDFKGYLDNRFIDFHYTGIDHQPEFILEAKQRYQYASETYFFKTDFSKVDFPKVDYVIASGSLSYRCSNFQFVFEMIAKMYLTAGIGVAFNMLDGASFPEHPILVGRDVAIVVGFCRLLCSDVWVVQGYCDGDFTVFLGR